jgi:hypothetical protein
MGKMKRNRTEREERRIILQRFQHILQCDFILKGFERVL